MAETGDDIGGIDRIIFTGGVSEHAASLRSGVLDKLGWLGVRLDAASNERHAGRISSVTSAIVVDVIATDEEGIIARHCHDLIDRASAALDRNGGGGGGLR